MELKNEKNRSNDCSWVGCVGSTVFAELSFGVRGSVGFSNLDVSEDGKRELGESVSNEISSITGTPATYSVSMDPLIASGFAFWGNYSFEKVPAIGLQAELGFLFGNGTDIKCGSHSGFVNVEINDKFTYTTMELPFLFTYTVNKGGFFEFIPQGGLYLSLPLGKLKQEAEFDSEVYGQTVYNEKETTDYTIDSACVLGFACGFDCAFNFTNSSALLLNMRYMRDITNLKSDGDEIGKRTVYLFSAGYRYTIKK